MSMPRHRVVRQQLRIHQQDDEDADEDAGDHVVLPRRVGVHLVELRLEDENRNDLPPKVTRSGLCCISWQSSAAWPSKVLTAPRRHGILFT